MLLIPQSSHSSISYALDPGTSNILVFQDGHSKPIGSFSQDPMQRMQSSDYLVEFGLHQADTLRVYSKEGHQSTINLGTSGPLFFVEKWGNAYVSGMFRGEDILFYKYDKSGKITKTEAFQANRIQMLYTAGTIKTVILQDQLYAWVPAFGVVFVLDSDLSLMEMVTINRPEIVARFDGSRTIPTFDAQEQLSPQDFIAYAKKHEGDVIKVTPASLFLREGEPCLVYHIVQLESKLGPTGVPNLRTYSILVSMEGLIHQTIEGEVMGLRSGRILCRRWSHEKSADYYLELEQQK